MKGVRETSHLKYHNNKWRTGYFAVGCQMYNQDEKSFRLRFVEVDMLATDFFHRNEHLKVQFDYVHTANVIHLFNEEQQMRFIIALAFLVKLLASQ